MKPRTDDGRTQKRVAVVACGVLMCVGVGAGLHKNRWRVRPKRFGVVEPGWLYRGGQVDARLIDCLAGAYRIEGILALVWLRPDHADEAAELELIRQRSIELKMIPMPGDGLAGFDELDEAADWIEAHHGRPVFVHCAAGVNRTGAVIAAYRVRHCGWALQDALAEARRFGMRDRDGALTEHLGRYYKEHLPLAVRLGRASGTD